MNSNPYIALAEALAAAGLTGQRSRPDQLIVSAQQGPVWPNRGNSFWLSQAQPAFEYTAAMPHMGDGVRFETRSEFC